MQGDYADEARAEKNRPPLDHINRSIDAAVEAGKERRELRLAQHSAYAPLVSNRDSSPAALGEPPRELIGGIESRTSNGITISHIGVHRDASQTVLPMAPRTFDNLDRLE